MISERDPSVTIPADEKYPFILDKNHPVHEKFWGSLCTESVYPDDAVLPLLEASILLGYVTEEEV